VTKRVRVIASGLVQGVFYRVTCAERARELGLGGFVRNLADGRVEAAFEGADAAVDVMVAWRRSGTDWSRVDHLDASEELPTGDREFLVTR